MPASALKARAGACGVSAARMPTGTATSVTAKIRIGTERRTHDTGAVSVDRICLLLGTDGREAILYRTAALDENTQDFIGHQHPLPRQPEAAGGAGPQPPPAVGGPR